MATNDPHNPPSPNLVPIPPAEFPNYFFRYCERDFPLHRHPPELRSNYESLQLPSVLPIDRDDMVRRTVQHNLVYLGLGHRHWFGPFERHIDQPDGKLVVDVGSDNGRWIEDVSYELPHSIHFRGIEIFPSRPTEAANNNVHFEVYDFQREGIRHPDASVDVVHARFQNFHILEWDEFLKDAARCLKPGGLFMSGELDIYLQYADGQPLAVTSATTQFYTQVQRLMIERGYTPDIGTQMVGKLNEMRNTAGDLLFTNIGQDVCTLPMSANNGNNPDVDADQREMSILSTEYLEKLATSLRPFLLSTRQAEVEVDGLLQGHMSHLRQMEARMTYRFAWAERTSARA